MEGKRAVKVQSVQSFSKKTYNRRSYVKVCQMFIVSAGITAPTEVKVM